MGLISPRLKQQISTLAAGMALLCCGCSTVPSGLTNETLVQQVTDAELAFARSMADRAFDTFKSFIADEAIFMAGSTPLRGKVAVADFWKRFFQTPVAPFSWKPDRVQVLDSGTLAKSSGPVANQDGSVSQRFNSIWRRDADGRWRVVFDEGSPVCRCSPN